MERDELTLLLPVFIEKVANNPQIFLKPSPESELTLLLTKLAKILFDEGTKCL
jgi:hypothetical protein